MVVVVVMAAVVVALVAVAIAAGSGCVVCIVVVVVVVVVAVLVLLLVVVIVVAVSAAAVGGGIAGVAAAGRKFRLMSGCFLAPDLLLAGSLHAQLIQLCTGCRLAWMVALLSSASGCQWRGWRFPLRMLDSMGNRQPTGVQTAC